MMSFDLTFAAPTLLLLTASLWDLKTCRFPNPLFLGSLLLAVAMLAAHTSSLMSLGWIILQSCFLFVALTPLVFAGALGAGDLKLLFCLSVMTSPMTTLWVLFYSLFWGLSLGLFKLFFAGQLVPFAQSFVLRNPQVSAQRIPYTVALLLGWMTCLSLRGGL